MKFLTDIDKENIMLINIIYHSGTKESNYVDYLDIIYKDLNTNEKYLKTIEYPEIEIYFAKEKYRNYTYNKSFFELQNTESHICRYKDLPFYIAKQAGQEYMNYIKQCKETNKFSAIKNIHKYPYVFGSDYDIENWYRIQWLLEYDNNRQKKITKTFLDIEVDSISVPGFPKGGECPINAVTMIDDESNSSFTFLLENKDNPQIQEFKDNIEDFIQELHDSFDESYGFINYYIYMYEDEKELLIDLFKLINTLKRDFCLIWNMPFDIPYIIDRLRVLGLNPAQVMCHKDFKIKEVYFMKDYNNFAIANKKDYLKISSYTVFLDDMKNYAAIRKSGGQLRSYSLNAISELELKDNKLDYSEDANIKTLPYINYRKFTKYNIKDVLLQKGLENKTFDVDNIYQRAYNNATCYQKVFSQTIFLKNRAYLEYYKQGLIIGNNANIDYGVKQSEKEKGSKKNKFDGALVGNPLFNSFTGIKILGKRSMYIYDNVIDMDFSSMYPNIIITFNISPNCMIGKLIISKKIEEVIRDTMNDLTSYLYDEDDEENENNDNILNNIQDEKYDAGKDFIDNLLVGDIPNMGIKWFSLPNMEQLDQLIRNKFKINDKIKIIVNPNDFNQYYIEGLTIDA